MNYNSINPTSLSRYVGLIKNFSPLQRNKLSLKKNSISKDKNLENNLEKKTTTNTNYFQASSQFLKYKTLKPYLNKSNNSKTFKSINTNNYIINTLNLSEKKIINNTSLEPQNETVDFDINYKKLKKEKEELEKKISAQKKLIQKLIEDNEKLDSKFNEIYEENCKIRNVLSSYKDTQEQLIILIKLVQKNGVDVEGIIDKWNNEVENENNNSDNISQEKEISSISDKQDYKDNKFDPSFTPIVINENDKKDNSIKVSNVPKLNFSNLQKRIQSNQLKENQKNENGKNKNKRNLSQGDLNENIDKLEIESINKKMENINIKKKTSPKKFVLKK